MKLIIPILLENDNNIKKLSTILNRTSESDGTTPLMQAVIGNQVDVVEYLLFGVVDENSNARGKKIVDTSMKTKEDNFDALNLALMLKRDERIVELIQKYNNNQE